MSASHPACLPPDQLERQCRVRFTRRSGPGGQHRNKVETAVVIRHLSTGISAEANERRSQMQNRQQALFRLRVNLAVEVRSDGPLQPALSDCWKSRLSGGKILINPSHDDFPSLLAEALDVIFNQSGDVKLAAARLECTPSQLVRFLKLEPRALGAVNRRRLESGMAALH